MDDNKTIEIETKSTDCYSKAVRSRVMRSVRSTGNKSTELFFIDLLDAFKIIGWKRHYPVRGKPDFVFLKHRIAIFIDGCFWHGHECKKNAPKQNSVYWKQKIERNKQRDKEIKSLFEKRGWNVFRIWECQLSESSTISILKFLKKTTSNEYS